MAKSIKKAKKAGSAKVIAIGLSVGGIVGALLCYFFCPCPRG